MIAFLTLARMDAAPGRGSDRSVDPVADIQTESELIHGDSADRSSVTAQRADNSASSMTEAELEQRAENLAERREKLDYFYISAFTAILVFTFNNFNSRSGILVKAPLWLVEVGWGSLIAAALCPLYVISVRFKAFAMNLDRITGKTVDKKVLRGLRRRSEFIHHSMALFFVVGVGSLCAAYALGLSQIKR